MAIETFNSKLPDELLDGETFRSLAEVKGVIESWRQHYNTTRSHSSFVYKPPAGYRAAFQTAPQLQPDDRKRCANMVNIDQSSDIIE